MVLVSRYRRRRPRGADGLGVVSHGIQVVMHSNADQDQRCKHRGEHAEPSDASPPGPSLVDQAVVVRRQPILPSDFVLEDRERVRGLRGSDRRFANLRTGIALGSGGGLRSGLFSLPRYCGGFGMGSLSLR
jgi:hypothetical protein